MYIQAFSLVILPFLIGFISAAPKHEKIQSTVGKDFELKCPKKHGVYGMEVEFKDEYLVGPKGFHEWQWTIYCRSFVGEGQEDKVKISSLPLLKILLIIIQIMSNFREMKTVQINRLYPLLITNLCSRTAEWTAIVMNILLGSPVRFWSFILAENLEILWNLKEKSTTKNITEKAISVGERKSR